MNKYTALVKELRLVLSTNQVLQMIFTTVIVFLVVYTAAFFLELWPLYAALGVALVSVLYQARKLHANYQLVQEKYPDLADAIQAFQDTIGEKGYMVDKLREDVLKRIKTVRNSDFLDYKGLYKKLAWCLGLFMVLMVVTVFHLQYPVVSQVQKIPFEKLTIDNLFTVKSDAGYVAQLNERQDSMAFNYRQQFDLTQEEDPELKEFEADNAPTMQIGSDDIFVERISAEEEEVIKKYFKQIG